MTSHYKQSVVTCGNYSTELRETLELYCYTWTSSHQLCYHQTPKCKLFITLISLVTLLRRGYRKAADISSLHLSLAHGLF